MERKLANWHWQRGALAVAVALVVSCLFVPPAGARAKTDREQAGLIGPVQTGSTVPVSFRRDQDGHLVIAREGERLVSTYDLQGNEIETAAYNSPSPGGSLYDKRSYTYDAQGKRTEMVSYHGDGSFWGKTVYIYDAQGHLTQTVSEEPARHIHNTVSNFYDAQ